ncbi:MAG: autotransporter domain-containing protein [Proteobacteria bacterium]|nr:autotransporter domain-containing protein [Pseudomonadota bacterium]
MAKRIYGSDNVGAGANGGSNTITNTGTATGNINGSVNEGTSSSGGSNTITNSGTVAGNIVGSRNTGSGSSGGSNTITNTGTVTGNILGSRNSGAGSSSTGNTITNSGTVTGDIYGSRNSGTGSSGGDDTITNSGTVGGSIYARDGDDRVNLEGGSSVGGAVRGGSGTDTLGLSNMGAQDAALWGTTYVSFEKLAFYGGSTTLTGDWSVSGSTTVESGGNFRLDPGTSLNTSSFGTDSGGAATVNGSLTTDTTTNNGSLGVNGTLTSPTVTNNGILGGTGTIAGNVTNNGTVSPGNSIGTLSINGNFTNNAGGVLAVELASGSGDVLKVSGTATLNGGTLRASLRPAVYVNGTSWNVLKAGKINGAFGNLNFGTTSATLSLDMVTTSRALKLELSRKPYADFGDTPGRRDTGAGLDAIVPLAQGRGGDMATLITAMDFSYSAAQIITALGQMSPEMYTAFSWASLQSTQGFGDALDQQMDQPQVDQRKGPQPAKVKEPAAAKNTAAASSGPIASSRDWNLWARFLGAKAERNGGSGSGMGYGQSIDGVVLGGDGQLASWLKLGLAMGISRGDLSWDIPSYYGRMNNFHASLYGSADWGQFYARAVLVLSYHESTAHRSINFASYNGTANADFNGKSGMFSLRGGYDLRLGNWRVGPTGSVRYTLLEQNGFNESGAGSLSLAVADQSVNSLQSSLGFRASTLWDLGGLRLAPQIGVAWWHEFKDDPYQVQASFMDYGDSAFTVRGLAPPADYAVIGAGFSALLTDTLKANLELTLALGDDYYSQAVNFGAQYWF